MFLTLMIVGLVGLLLMAMPAFGRHGHAAHGVHAARGGGSLFGRGGGGRLGGGRAGGAAGGAARTAIAAGTAGAAASAAGEAGALAVADGPAARLLRWIPSPRAVCSVLALYGAFGNALEHAAHLHRLAAALGAVIPALLVEYFLVRPVWNLVFRFQAPPASPFAALLLSEAQAVVPFRNGRGVVSVVRDGRVVQLAASLRDDQHALPVRVGDRLRVEDVDPTRERVTVSILTAPQEPSCPKPR